MPVYDPDRSSEQELLVHTGGVIKPRTVLCMIGLWALLVQRMPCAVVHPTAAAAAVAAVVVVVVVRMNIPCCLPQICMYGSNVAATNSQNFVLPSYLLLAYQYCCVVVTVFQLQSCAVLSKVL